MNIGITSFGLDQFPVSNIINEYKQFVEANSKFHLNIQSKTSTNLPLSEIEEIHYDANDPTKVCYFATPASISASTKSFLPPNVDLNMIMWNPQNHNVCWGGVTWKGNIINNVPFISIGFAWPNTGWGPWKNSYSQTLTHEWIHVVASFFANNGYTNFPNVDRCGDYGFPTGDQGWQDCFKYIFSTITDAMYKSIGELCTNVNSKISI